jgi:hypothetical protein
MPGRHFQRFATDAFHIAQAEGGMENSPEREQQQRVHFGGR